MCAGSPWWSLSVHQESLALGQKDDGWNFCLSFLQYLISICLQLCTLSGRAKVVHDLHFPVAKELCHIQPFSWYPLFQIAFMKYISKERQNVTGKYFLNEINVFVSFLKKNRGLYVLHISVQYRNLGLKLTVVLHLRWYFSHQCLLVWKRLSSDSTQFYIAMSAV